MCSLVLVPDADTLSVRVCDSVC
eukprot:COSAG03_NODE_39279_length_103_cov_1.500000_1_plen_22_part_01